MKLKIAALAATALTAALVLSTPASAALNVSIPTTNYITYGGLDWAWASPCAAYAPSCGSTAMTAFQAAEGWRIPTLDEFLGRPEVPDFGGKCASAYFGSGHGHCDFGDPDYGFGQITGVKPHGYLFDYGYGITANGSSTQSETWFVRGAAGVPEPATWALMIGGFGLAGSALRRRRTVAA